MNILERIEFYMSQGMTEEEASAIVDSEGYDRVIRYSDGSILITSEVLNGDMHSLKVDVVEALYAWEDILAQAELSKDTTDEEMEEYGNEAYAMAVEELYKRVEPYLTLRRNGRTCFRDGEGNLDGDYLDEYKVTYRREL